MSFGILKILCIQVSLIGSYLFLGWVGSRTPIIPQLRHCTAVQACWKDPGVRLQGREKAGVRISADCPKFTSLQQGLCQSPQLTALRCLNWTAVIQMKIRTSLPKKAGVSSVWVDQFPWCKAPYKTTQTRSSFCICSTDHPLQTQQPRHCN